MDSPIIEKLEKEEKNSSRKGYLFQIDFLKATMIFLVIFDHFVAWTIKGEIAVSLWERISIPVFLVIMGFNMGLSFQREGVLTLKELYSWDYFKKKIFRFLIPFFILYGVSTFIGLFMYNFDWIAMFFGQYYPDHGFIDYFVGFLPFWGPGNWFLPVIFGSILLLPLLYWFFTKNKVLTLIFCFIIEFSMQLIVFFLIGEIDSWLKLYIYLIFATNILFYLSGIGLGMWFSFGYKITEKRNIFMWVFMSVLFVISLIFIIFYQFFDFRFYVDGTLFLRGDYHFLFIPYSAFLVLLALLFLPSRLDLKLSRIALLGLYIVFALYSICLFVFYYIFVIWLLFVFLWLPTTIFIILVHGKTIGRATYHILLTQILGYAMITARWGTHYGMDLPFNPLDIIDLIGLWVLFIGFGVLWYKIDRQKDIGRRILYYINFFTVFPSVLLLTFWIQGLWVPIPLIMIIFYAFGALIFHYIIKKPLSTELLIIWSVFVLFAFISMVLQVSFLGLVENLILNILLGVYLVFAVIYSYFKI